MSGIPTSDEARREALARQVSFLVANGRRIESQSEFFAVVARGPRPLERREVVRVDELGNTSVQQLPFSRDQIITLVGIGLFAAFLVLVWILGVVNA